MYCIYTDGSCLGNPGPGGVGIVITKDGQVLEQLSYGTDYTTNNQMELEAAISGIAYFRENYNNEEIVIITDSNYVVQGITTWIIKWKKNNFQGRKNVELWKELDKISSNCQFKHTYGHSGDLFNEMADKLASEAAKEYK